MREEGKHLTHSKSLLTNKALKPVMPSRYDESNVLTVKPGLKVLKQIATSEEGSYSSEISEKTGMSRTDASRILRTLHDMEVAEQGKRTRAQYYEVNPEGLLQLFCQIWGLDQEEVPEEFQGFLMDWVKIYDKGDSSIRRMLREDFAEALDEYRRDNNDELPDQLKFLEDVDRMKGYVNVKAYLDRILEK